VGLVKFYELLLPSKLLNTKKRNELICLIELLVVIAIIASLSFVLASALGKGKLKSYYINEINSAKQITLEQYMYNHDHERIYIS